MKKNTKFVPVLVEIFELDLSQHTNFPNITAVVLYVYGCYQITSGKVNTNCDWYYFAASVQSLLQMKREKSHDLVMTATVMLRMHPTTQSCKELTVSFFLIYRMKIAVAVSLLVCILSSIQLVIEGREDGNNVFLS